MNNSSNTPSVKSNTSLKSRKPKTRVEDINSQIPDALLEKISQTLTKQIDKEIFNQKYAKAADILKLVGMGIFVAGSLVIPNLPLALKPFLDHQRKKEYNVWKRFNIPYLKRTLERLEKQQLIETSEEDNMQVVKITEAGKRKILKFAIDELAVEKPKIWSEKWTLISYDIPKELSRLRKVFLEYLKAWGFYPLHESVYLHAYPCDKQVEFLRSYLAVTKYVRIFTVSNIENDKLFRDFFGV